MARFTYPGMSGHIWPVGVLYGQNLVVYTRSAHRLDDALHTRLELQGSHQVLGRYGADLRQVCKRYASEGHTWTVYEPYPESRFLLMAVWTVMAPKREGWSAFKSCMEAFSHHIKVALLDFGHWMDGIMVVECKLGRE
ncbi:hypothetical protein BKA70DRAFT_1413482 [Coprinopsis sp. MPI-PUGE-AT-0042]|nr:hypothetical protein BKA70DRAFT_1413482 [Coprinopsis sp. MPI-PUGE-AT-0042]